MVKSKKKKKSPQAPDNLLKATALAAIIITLISTLVKITGFKQLWGYVPLFSGNAWWLVPSALVTVLLLIMLLAEKEDILFREVAETGSSRLHRLAAYGIACCGTVAVAWWLRSENHFMGDGWAAIGRVGSEFSFKNNEPLDFFLHQAADRLLGTLGVAEGVHAYSITHTVLLPFYLLLLWLTAGQLTGNRKLRGAVFMLAASGAALQLFFGYVESYTFLHLFLAAYLYVSLRYLKTDNPGIPLLPTLFFLLAAAAHHSAVVLAPSLLFMILARYSPGKQFSLAGRQSLTVLTACSILFMLGMLFIDVPGMILKHTDEMVYRFYDLAHLEDKLNYLLLAVPFFPLFLLIFLVRAGHLATKKDTRLAFLFWAAAGCVAFVLIFYSMLGIRDWDIMALPAVPLSLLGAYILIDTVESANVKTILIFSLGLATLTNTLTFVWINSEESRGAEYLVELSDVEKHNTVNLLQFGHLLTEKKYRRLALRVFEKIPSGPTKGRADFNEASVYLSLENPTKAIEILSPYLRRTLDDVGQKLLYMDLSIAHDMRGEIRKATEYFLRLLDDKLPVADSEIKRWSEFMKYSSKKNDYGEHYEHDMTPLHLEFLIRFYSMASDKEILDQLTNLIITDQYNLARKYTVEDLKILIRLSRHNGQKTETFLKMATYLFPGRKEEFQALAQPES